MFDRFRTIALTGSERTVKAKKNILASFLNKGIAVIISLLLVPVTIDYLDTEQYGIWLTLSSIVAWVSYFDIGLGHGFRNRFAEAKAKKDIILARKYVTTAYVALFLIFGIILLVGEVINPYISWDSLLNVSVSNALLQQVVSILLIGFCLYLVLNISSIMLSADQKPAASAMITTLGQGMSLAVIYVFTKTTEGDMTLIAVALNWVPSIVLFLITLYLFYKPYHDYAPSLACFDFKLVKNIVGLGSKFFIIQICMLLIFQVTNVILSRVLGPEAVTEYNVSYKYFSITQMVFNIILSPFWSAFTDAYTKNDYEWMKIIQKKLSRIWLILVGINFFLLSIVPFAYRLWLGDSVQVSWPLSICMMVYFSVLSYSNMYMILLNGIGKVFLQMLIYIICACVGLPLSYYFCGIYGIPGTIFVLATVYFMQAVFAKIQLNKILSGSCTGIMNL